MVHRKKLILEIIRLHFGDTIKTVSDLLFDRPDTSIAEFVEVATTTSGLTSQQVQDSLKTLIQHNICEYYYFDKDNKTDKAKKAKGAEPKKEKRKREEVDARVRLLGDAVILRLRFGEIVELATTWSHSTVNSKKHNVAEGAAFVISFLALNGRSSLPFLLYSSFPTQAEENYKKVREVMAGFAVLLEKKLLKNVHPLSKMHSRVNFTTDSPIVPVRWVEENLWPDTEVEAEIEQLLAVCRVRTPSPSLLVGR